MSELTPAAEFLARLTSRNLPVLGFSNERFAYDAQDNKIGEAICFGVGFINNTQHSKSNAARALADIIASHNLDEDTPYNGVIIRSPLEFKMLTDNRMMARIRVIFSFGTKFVPLNA